MAAGLWVAASLWLATPVTARELSCRSTHWVGVWEAAPSDASQGNQIEDLFAPSEVIGAGDKKLPVDNQTIRLTLTPTYGGSTLRVHLSNRFGTRPATFSHVTIGKQASGATLDGAPVTLTYAGKDSVTVPAGDDVISDPARLSFAAMQTLEVSVYIAGDAGMATEHYTGRQATYFTLDGMGDHSDDVSGGAFLLTNSTRPYVDGIDAIEPADVGAVVAFGDSITDGFQAETAEGIPAASEGYNVNERWPDFLARRLLAAHIPLAVLNVGISGNRVLVGGTYGGGPDVYGPSALSRLQKDVLDQAGVTTVIWLEGINDIGQGPTLPAAQIEAGYDTGIARMHAAGLKVLQGTLTPAGSDTQSSYGGAAANAERVAVNNWIETRSSANGVVNFSAAIADPADPAKMNPAYAGADGLHPNPAGYRVMANAINLSALRRLVCFRHRPRVKR